MVKRCIYCNYELENENVVDICGTCMYKVWGAKMADAIVQNMEREQGKGNLELGRVSEVEEEPEIVEVEKIEAVDEVPLREALLQESETGVVSEISDAEVDEFEALKSAEEVVEQLPSNVGEGFF